MSDSDTPEPRPAPTTMGAFAQRLMARWHTTPITTTVQRAVSARPVAGIGQSASAQTLVQRITERTQPLTAWHAKATSTETAIESFTDKVVQRFPDYGAKYLPRTEEADSPPSKDVDMVFSGGRATSGTAEASSSQPQGQSSTFDPNSLPSVPPEVMARHLKNRQAATETATAKTAVQRKATPPDPKLVRPRSRVDYFGSTAAPTPIAPVNTKPASTETIQAKADDSASATPATLEVVPDTPPIEQPTFRTRPRAGFQTIPTKNMSAPPGEGSKDVPFVPLQLKAEPEATIPGTAITDAPSNPTTDTPIQRVADDEKGSDDEPPPSNDVPPDGPPPPPPAPVSPNDPLQRVAAEPGDAQQPVDMPLRQHPNESTEAHPSDDTPVQRQVDEPRTTRASVGTPIQRQSEVSTGSVPVTLPPLSSAVPAKVVRRKMAAPAPEQVRKPVTYKSPTHDNLATAPSVSPVQRQVSDVPSALPISSGNAERIALSGTESVAADIETQRDIPQRQDMPLVAASISEAPQADTLIQRMVDSNAATPIDAPVASGTESTVAVPTVAPSVRSDAPLQRRTVEPSAPNGEGESAVGSVSAAPTTSNELPVQRKATDAATSAHIDNPTISVAAQPTTVTPAPSRSDMPLREVDNATVPIQRQAEEASTLPDTVTEASRSVTAELPVTTTPIQWQADATPTTINRGQESNITAHIESSASAIAIKRKSESTPVVPAPQTDSTSSPTALPTAPIQRAVAEESIPAAESPDYPTPSSYVNETRSEVNTPPLQRQVNSTGDSKQDAVSIETASVSPAVLTRADMPLRITEDASPVSTPDTPVQRQVADIAPSTPTVANAVSTSGTPIQRQVAERINDTSGTPLSVVETPSQSISENTGTPTSNAPIQRQVPDSAPTTNMADAPSTNATKGAASDAPIQRVSAELPARDIDGNRVEMPLRLNDAPSAPDIQHPVQRDVDSSTPPTREVIAANGQTTAASPITIQRQAISNQTTAEPRTAHASTSAESTASPTAQPTASASTTSPTAILGAPIQRVAVEDGNEDTASTNSDTPLRVAASPQSIANDVVEMPLRFNNTPSASDTEPIQRATEDTASAAPAQVTSPATVSDQSGAPQNVSVASGSVVSSATSGTLPVQRKVDDAAVPDVTREVTQGIINRASANEQIEMPLRTPVAPSPISESVAASNITSLTPASAPIQRVAVETQDNEVVVQRVASVPQAGSAPLQSVATDSQGDEAAIQRVAAQPTNNTTHAQVQATPLTSERLSRADMPLRESETTSPSNSTIQRQPDDTQPSETRSSVISPTTQVEAATSASSTSSQVEAASTTNASSAPIQRVADDTVVIDASPSLDTPVRVTPALASSNTPEMPLRENAPLQRQVAETGASTAAEHIVSLDSTSTGSIESSISFGTPNAPTQNTSSAAPIQRRTIEDTTTVEALRVTAEAQPRPSEAVTPVEMPLRALSSDAPVQRRTNENAEIPSLIPSQTEAAASTAQITDPSTPVTAASIPGTSPVTTATDNAPIQRKVVANEADTPSQRRSDTDSAPIITATPTIQTATPPEMPLRVAPVADTTVVQRQTIADAPEPFGPDVTVANPAAATTASTVQHVAAPASNETDAAPVKVTPTRAEPVQRVAMPLRAAPLESSAISSSSTHIAGMEVSARLEADALPVQRKADPASPLPSVSVENSDYAPPSVVQRMNATPVRTLNRTTARAVQRKADTNGSTSAVRPLHVTVARSSVQRTTALPLALVRDADKGIPEPTIQRAVGTPAEYTDSTPDMDLPVARVSPTIQRNEASPLPRTLRHLSQEGTPPTTLSSQWEALPIQRQSDSTPTAREGMPLAAPATLLTSPSISATDQIDMVIQRRDTGADTSTTTTTSSTPVDNEPSESDTQRALETLARQIYPLLKQMLQRDRERHRGF